MNRLLGVSAIIAVIALFGGCEFIISMFDGTLYPGNMQVVLNKDRPSYRARGEKNNPGNTIGTLDRRAGDTVNTIGWYKGGFGGISVFLIRLETQEVYIDREDVLTPDDQIYSLLGSGAFSLTHMEDNDAWNRAWDYIESHAGTPIDVASENLIKTTSSTDTASIQYIVTRAILEYTVNYEIICRSSRPGFNAADEANQMAFFMATGRMFEYEK
ncbi:MAG: hypothetical protein WBQ23_10335 [Bacteroidota bacterium]